MGAPKLTIDEIDDLLYFARANEVDDLKTTLSETALAHKAAEKETLEAAIDEDNGNSVLHYASANGHIDIVKAILDIIGSRPQLPPDASPDENDPAASSSSSQTLADSTPQPFLSARNSSGNTALHWAALNGHVETILLLLQHGADPSLLNKSGHDALYEAEVNEKEKAVEVLLREGGGLEEGVKGKQEDGEKDSNDVDDGDDDDDGEDVEIRVRMGDVGLDAQDDKAEKS